MPSSDRTLGAIAQSGSIHPTINPLPNAEKRRTNMNTQIVNEIRREDGNAHFNAIYIVRARAAKKSRYALAY